MSSSTPPFFLRNFQLQTKKKKEDETEKYFKIKNINLSRHKNSLETLRTELRGAHSIKRGKKSRGKKYALVKIRYILHHTSLNINLKHMALVIANCNKRKTTFL